MELDLGALFRPDARGSGWRRMPAVAGEAMIATSHPLATAAGLEAYGAGGNAVDAALAAAAVLVVAEPTENGLGGDAFALGPFRRGAADPRRQLWPGALVELAAEGIGTLRNRLGQR